MIEVKSLAPASTKIEPSPKLRHRRNPVFWQIRKDIPRSLYYSMVALSFALPLLGWSLISYSGLVEPLFMPTPTAVIQRASGLLQSGQLLDNISASVMRMLWGFGISAILSIPIGLAIGTFKSIEGLLEPVLGLFRYMPAAAFIPLIILWLGLGEPPKIAIVFLGSFFYNILMIADAVKFISLDKINAAYTLGATTKDVFLRVIFPATLPNIIDTLRINLAGAWNFVVVAELVASNSGLGHQILLAQRYMRTDEIFVGIIIIGLIGLAGDFAFKLLFRTLVPWAVDR